MMATRIMLCLFALALLPAHALQLVQGSRPAMQQRACSPQMKGAFVRSGDMVKVITGDEKGNTGKVLSVNMKKGKIMVEGINVRTKHVKPRKEGESGQILKKELPIAISNVVQVDAPAAAEEVVEEPAAEE